MSRPYRIVVQKLVESEVRAGDRSTLRLKIDQILSEEDTDRLLSGALERNGWTKAGDGVYKKRVGEDELMTLDVGQRELTTEIEAGTTVTQQRRRELRGDTWNWKQMREMTRDEMTALREKAESELGDEVTEEARQEAYDQLKADLARRLDEGEPERRKEVNRLVIETVSEALKEKARELGNVQRVDESWHGDDYELTITVSE